MSQLDYQPLSGGVPVDPAVGGGAVSTLELYTDADHSGIPVSVGPAAVVRPGVYRFTIDDTAVGPGRYWPRILWTATSGGPTQVDDRYEPLDLPTRADLALSPEDIAVRLGIALPITAEQRYQLSLAILDAQEEVAGRLSRAILPQIITERRPWSAARGLEYLAEQPVWDLLTEVEESVDGVPTGYWVTTYIGGMNVRADARLRPILRVLRALAMNHDLALALWKTVGAGAAIDGTGARVVKSVSAEGQSISYDTVRPGGAVTGDAALVGAPIPWSTIDRWNLTGKKVFQRSTRRAASPIGTITVGP